jgi:hypothetical protein
MKRSIVVVLMLGLLAGAVTAAPAEAKKKKKKAPVRVERVVEEAYTGGGIGVLVAGTGGGFCPFRDASNLECFEFPLQAGETYIKVEVTDATGTSLAGSISQGDTDGDGVGNLYGSFCGAHEEAIPMEDAAAPVRVSFYLGACEDGSPSLPTTGTIKVTFSNMP